MGCAQSSPADEHRNAPQPPYAAAPPQVGASWWYCTLVQPPYRRPARSHRGASTHCSQYPPQYGHPAYGGKTGASVMTPDTTPWDQRQAVVTKAAPTPFGARLPGDPLRSANAISVGIDFGTARSGYAFVYGTDNVPQLQFAWPGEADRQVGWSDALCWHRSFGRRSPVRLQKLPEVTRPSPRRRRQSPRCSMRQPSPTAARPGSPLRGAWRLTGGETRGLHLPAGCIRGLHPPHRCPGLAVLRPFCPSSDPRRAENTNKTHLRLRRHIYSVPPRPLCRGHAPCCQQAGAPYSAYLTLRRYVTVPPREQSRYAYLESFKLLLTPS